MKILIYIVTFFDDLEGGSEFVIDVWLGSLFVKLDVVLKYIYRLISD